MQKLIALAIALAFTGTAVAALPFSDVPKTHWAYDAIGKAVDAGILQGYNGKFEGQRLLNRYQMAVVVAKLIEAVKAPGGAALAGPANLKNIEALTTEFADELALLSTKVSALEGTTEELKKEVENMKGGGGGTTGGGLGFTAYASFGLINTDDGAALAPTSPVVTRYSESPDATFFTLPQVSIGVDKEVNPGVYFHAQFDYASDVNDMNTGKVAINEAYFFVDEIFGDIGGKVGAFALPFSMEHNGPFRTCNLTITPSFLNSINEGWRAYGLEFQKVKDIEPSAIVWKVGIVSGTDGSGSRLATFVDGLPGAWTDQGTIINQGEMDDAFGYYLYIGKKPEKTGFGWNVGYFDNGGSLTDGSAEVSFWQVGAEWWGDKFGVMGQYQFGTIESLPNDSDYAAWYVLFNFKADDKNNVTFRFDRAQTDPGLGTAGFADYFVHGYTFAWNHKVTENSLLQFEYLVPDEDIRDDHLPVGVAFNDQNDDLIQIRYKVHF